MQVGPIPVLVSVFYRFVVAALVLIIALFVTRRLETPALRHQPFLIAQAFCLFSFNFICFYTAAAYVTSRLRPLRILIEGQGGCEPGRGGGQATLEETGRVDETVRPSRPQRAMAR
jgi:hypothetical protein